MLKYDLLVCTCWFAMYPGINIEEARETSIRLGHHR